MEVIRRIREDEGIWGRDESAIKQAMILRLLGALGWDPFDVSEVYPEYSLGRGRVDYALMHEGKPKVFLEVKKPAESLEHHHEQLLGYAFREGVPLAVLTNGVSWWFYRPLEEGRWEDRKFYTIDLLDQDVEDAAGMFEKLLSKDSVISGKSFRYAEEIYRSRKRMQVLRKALPEAWRRIIERPDEELVSLLADAVERMSGYRPDPDMVEVFLKRIAGHCSETTPNILEDEGTTDSPSGSTEAGRVPPDFFTGKSIRAFTFRGKRVPVSSWKEFLVKVSGMLASAHGRDFERVLGLRGRKRPYFSRSRRELRSPEPIGDTGIYVETNLSARSIVDIVRRMLKEFGYPEDAISVVDLRTKNWT